MQRWTNLTIKRFNPKPKGIAATGGQCAGKRGSASKLGNAKHRKEDKGEGGKTHKEHRLTKAKPQKL